MTNGSKERELKNLPGPGQYKVERALKKSQQYAYKFGKSARDFNVTDKSKDSVGPASYKL